jgi:hypothetical protein
MLSSFSRFMVQDLDSLLFSFHSFLPTGNYQIACLVSFTIVFCLFFFGGGRHYQWQNEPITSFSFFPPFDLFLAPSPPKLGQKA